MKPDYEKENLSNQDLVAKICEGDENAFKVLFFKYFHDLCSFATQITRSQHQAKDVVQEVFFKLWKNRESWKISSSVKAYLYQSVRNQSFNAVDKIKRHTNLHQKYAEEYIHLESKSEAPDDNIKLIKKIWSIVDNMPERRQAIFVLHRRHGLKYKEIAEVLDLSPKTVETHMGLALRDIRSQLSLDI